MLLAFLHILRSNVLRSNGTTFKGAFFGCKLSTPENNSCCVHFFYFLMLIRLVAMHFFYLLLLFSLLSNRFFFHSSLLSLILSFSFFTSSFVLGRLAIVFERSVRCLWSRNLAKSGEVSARFLVLHCRLNFRVVNLNARLNGIYVKLAFSIITFGCFY